MAAVTVIDALAQWDALTQREDATCNQVKKPSSTASQNTNTGCPTAWREKIADWCYQVVDHCALGRDVVSYAMSYFDRIIPHYCINDTLVHCSNKISPECMVSLSRGSFQYDQVVKMERIVLRGLNWHLHPATPHLFLEIFFSTSTDDDELMTEINETASYLLELAVCDIYFIPKKPSLIARAAILVAMDIVARPLRLNAMMENLLVNDNCSMVETCSVRLQQIYTLMIKQDTAQEIIPESDVSITSVLSVVS
eukprot:scaffold34602_cov129-Skeletonema_dohrnii-CCMP3373.AAC.8